MKIALGVPGDESQESESSLPSFAENLDSFIARVDSLEETLPLARLAVARARSQTTKRFGEFIATEPYRECGRAS
jgi:hypothetical protein